MNSVFSMMEELNGYSTEENWDEVEKTAEEILFTVIDDGTRAEYCGTVISKQWEMG